MVHRNTILKILIILILGIVITLSGYTQQSDNKLPDIFDKRGEAYFTFQINDISLLYEIGRYISIDNIKGDTVFAYANKEGFLVFLDYNIQYTILTPPSQEFQPVMSNNLKQKGTASWNSYPTYSAYENMMYQFETSFPGLCRIYNLGTLSSGRKILVARITDNPDSLEAEPEFLYTSTMHGDEVTGFVLMLRLIDTLLNGYGSDTELTNLVNNTDIWINPLANPDGTYRSGNNNIYGAIRYNANWVDLNRNYPDPEDGPHPDNKAWQPETLIFMNLADSHNFTVSCNIHGGTEVCNYPWDTWSKLHPDNSWWYYVCRNWADTVHTFSPSSYLNGYNNGITNGYAWYSIAGGRQDYMNYFHYCREFTFEISDAKFPPASSLPAYWNYNYRSFINYIEETHFGVQGYVTDSLTGAGIKAKIWANSHDFDSSQMYSSLPHGNFSRPIYAGTYSLTFSAPGYYPKTIDSVVVVNGQAVNLVVQLVSSIVYYEVSGRTEYFNIDSTRLPGVNIKFSTTEDPDYLDIISGQQGEFNINGIQSDTYQVTSSSDSSWGGANSSDALLVAQHFVQIGPPLAGLKLQAANVNLDGNINTIDALLIQRRFVGLDSAFAAGNWVFEVHNINLDADTSGIIIKGLCVGDVNASRYNIKNTQTTTPAIGNGILRKNSLLNDK